MTFGTRESSRYSGIPVTLFLLQGAENPTADVPLGPYAFCDGETAIVRAGITYQPWPIKHSDLSHDGTLDKSDITVSLALGSPLDALFLAYPPSQVVNLTIFEGHIGDAVTPENFPATWMGRAVGGGYEDNELHLSGVPVSTSLKQPGLRRNYQIGCPHVLYGSQCLANKAAATVSRAVASVDRNKITMAATLGATYGQYIGGLVQWANSTTGQKELRTISAVHPAGLIITIRGAGRGLAAGTVLSISRGCNHQMSGCNLHVNSVGGGPNIQNYGGQPFIPLENPLSLKNQFY
ncbi:phage BR0599 family protein [Mesorhizobium sp. AR07]|uniref:phage BR0599 family protein n=1 Tax=Mesorhizobium sp. AR07 TaxID=2865838 RepID=UPI00215E5A3E|nr:phage BR0599 family protein [Mesorhizobium sp. AR07]UVK46809.1 phage BR0599 family protein [Mesorhizobium sp. AR07]